MSPLVFLFFVGIIRYGKSLDDPGLCVINPAVKSAFPKYPSLLADSRTGEWLHYEGDETNRKIVLRKGDSVFLECSPRRYFASIRPKINSLSAVCNGNNTFAINDDEGKTMKITTFKKLGCNKQPIENVVLKGKCGKNGTFDIAKIGYRTSFGFGNLIDVCFERSAGRSLWSRHNLTYEVDTATHGNDRPHWKADSLYDVEINEDYHYENQLGTFTDILGSKRLGEKYIHDDYKRILRRGHLSPRIDFLLASWQDATFHYINTAPQWHSFNGINWSSLERSVRQFAVELGKDLRVYTGTHEILSFKNESGEEANVFLHYEDGQGKIPIPKYFWKILEDPETKRGVAIVGVNNIFIKEDELDDYLICDEISHALTDSVKTKDNPERGFVYACSVRDLVRVVPDLPEELLEIDDLLRL